MQNELDCQNCNGTYKGLGCDCCKKKSQTAQDILEKINSLMGKSVATTTEETISELKNISAELSSVGGIDDIVAISEAFFSVPLENLKPEQLQLDDPNKTIDLTTGKTFSSAVPGPQGSSSLGLKVSTICDVPSLDITKILDFSKLGIDLSAMKKIQFSISVPTIVAEKMMNFGIVSVGMKFHIHRKGFSWFPTIGTLETREDALKNLDKLSKKGYKFPQQVMPVDKLPPDSTSTNVISLDEAKHLVSQQYSDSAEVMDAVQNSVDAADFFNRMTSIGIPIVKEIDPLEAVQKFIAKEEALKKINDQERGITSSDTPCGIKPPSSPLVPKPFIEEDLRKIEKDCCSESTEVPKPDKPQNGLDDLEGLTSMEDITALLDRLSNPLSDEDEQQAIKDVENFMNDVNKCSSAISAASKEKNNASNNWYWYTEAYALNKIAWEYVKTRIHVIDMLLNNISTLIQERHTLIQRQSVLASQRSSLILQTHQTMLSAGTLYENYTADNTPTVAYILDGVNIYSSSYQTMLQNSQFSSQVSLINTEFNQNQLRIDRLSGQIENLKNSNGIPTLSSSEITELKEHGIASLLDQMKAKKEIFNAVTNPVSNQVGFGGISDPVLIHDQNGVLSPIGGHVPGQNIELLHLFVDPHIYNESKALFSMNAVLTGDIAEYIVTADKRERAYGNEWIKFYSSNRIDRLFSYQEQGYTSPKPIFDDNGNPLGPDTTIEIKDPLGNVATQTAKQSLVDFNVNQDIAIEFWSGGTSGNIPGSGLDIEDKTKAKMLVLLNDVENSQTYQSYIASITAAAEMEAKLLYAANLIWEENSYDTHSYSAHTSTYTYQTPSIYNSEFLNNAGLANQYRGMHWLTYDAIDKFQNTIQDKIRQLEIFIEQKKKEIADGEECIAQQAENLRQKSENLNTKTVRNPQRPSQVPPKKSCIEKLGYDPTGKNLPIGCPDFTKNCYWKEYTKIMQLVSLMPIPDSENLMKRLFRYYPVGLQIPVVSPSGVLPTLASGIPDPMISIPMPIIWKHIVTLSTPLGTIVIWIALTGVIPCPYILYFDENMEACFLVTLKGPIGVPANSLRISEMDDKALIDLVKPFDELLNVDMEKAPWKFLFGNSKIKFSKDPDSANAFIVNIQQKIKSAVDGLVEMDWSLAAALGDNGPQGPQSGFYKTKERLRKAFKYIPPDIEIIEKALLAVGEAVDKQIDEMKISPIKIPKNPKKLITPVMGPAEFMDDINKLKDQGLASTELGANLKFLSLRGELKKMIDRELSEPTVKEDFAKINKEIIDLEQAMKLEGRQNTSEDVRKKITKRVKKIKKIIKIPVQKIADKISPEMLGVMAALSTSIPLPTPCYESKMIEPLPPYILSIIAAIKQLPDLIDTISDDALSNLIKIDLSMELPKIEDMIWFIIDVFLQFVPDMNYPDPKSVKILTQAVKAAIQNIFKTKIRMPHLPGTVQITITEAMVKNIIKVAVHDAFAAVVALMMEEIKKAMENKNVDMIVAIAMIIKALLGTELSDVGANEIKAILVGLLDAVDEALDELKTIIQPFESIKTNFKSIKEQLFPTLPPKPPIPKPEGPFMQLLTAEEIATLADPILEMLGLIPLPFPIILLGCATPATRLALTKMHPFMSKEMMPPWEKMSVKNVPFMIWMDQLIATAQKQGGFGSDYIAPYWIGDV